MAQQLDNGDGKTLFSPQKVDGEAGKSTMSSAFNFINSIIGSGIIGLPYALNQAGLPLGLLLLVMVAVITDYSIILLIRAGNLSGTESYQSLLHSTFGPPGFLVLSALQFLYPFIAMISYNIITGDTLTKVFQRIPGVSPDHILAERHFVILVSTILFTLPLSLYRNIAKLGKVSLLSMVFTIAILITHRQSGYVRTTDVHPPTDDAWVFAKWTAIQAVAIMSFTFTCHHNSFMIYGSLEEPILKNWARVTHVSVGSAAIVSALFAAAGYVTFTGYTQGDVFENYCRNDDLATFARFCYSVSIITTFPLECFVTREVVSNVFCNGPLSNTAHVAVTVLIVTACTAISLAYDCLGVVLELNGVLSATPLIFIIPSACFLKLSPGRWFEGENLIPAVLLLLGVFVMVTGLVMTGLYPQNCSHGVELFYCIANGTNSTPPT